MKSFVTQLSFLTHCDSTVYLEDGEGEKECVLRVVDGKDEFRLYLSESNVKTLKEMLTLFESQMENTK